METLKMVFGYVADFAKYTSSALFVLAIIAAVYYYNRYASAVYGFLKKYGISLWGTLVVLLQCRKDWANNSRMFMEYGIIETGGVKANKKKWKEIRSVFISKYIKSLRKTTVIAKDNTFVMANGDIKNAISDYFSHISKKKNRKRFAIQDLKYLSFIMDIEIAQGYIVPLVPICSLQKRYDSDWSKILSKYVQTSSSCLNDKIIPSELYSLYAWLMWGPSVQISEHDSEFKLCEYGLGDESMSLPVVLTKSEDAVALWKDLQNLSENNELGAFIKGKFKICETESYVKEKNCMFDVHNSLFAQAMVKDKAENPFVLEHIGHLTDHQLEKSNCLFSAYLWIMLYYTENGVETPFDCKRTAVWFEHANVSDRENTKFLKERLIDKVIKHLEHVWQYDIYNNRKYYVAWALNNNIVSELRRKIDYLYSDDSYKYKKEIKERLCFDSYFPPSVILNSIDCSFDESEFSINYINLDFTQDKHLGLLARFYCELYMKQFPDENERESLDNILAQAKRFNDNKKTKYYCIIATRRDNIAGGIIGDYFSESNSAAIEYVVVSPEERGNGLGGGLITQLKNYINNDAKKAGYKSMGRCFFEVENPAIIQDENDKPAAKKRMLFWDKFLSKKVCVDYVQPPLEAGKKEADNLMLMALPPENGDDAQTIKAAEVYSFLRDYFKYAVNVRDETVLNSYLLQYGGADKADFKLEQYKTLQNLKN